MCNTCFKEHPTAQVKLRSESIVMPTVKLGTWKRRSLPWQILCLLFQSCSKNMASQALVQQRQSHYFCLLAVPPYGDCPTDKQPRAVPGRVIVACLYERFKIIQLHCEIWTSGSWTDWCHRWRNHPRSFQLLYGPRTPLGKARLHSGKRDECATEGLFHLNEEFETLLKHGLWTIRETQALASCVTLVIWMTKWRVPVWSHSSWNSFTQMFSWSVELQTLDGTRPGSGQPFRLQPGCISLHTHGCARMHEISNTWSWNDWTICFCVWGWGGLYINLK